MNQITFDAIRVTFVTICVGVVVGGAYWTIEMYGLPWWATAYSILMAVAVSIAAFAFVEYWKPPEVR